MFFDAPHNLAKLVKHTHTLMWIHVHIQPVHRTVQKITDNLFISHTHTNCMEFLAGVWVTYQGVYRHRDLYRIPHRKFGWNIKRVQQTTDGLSTHTFLSTHTDTNTCTEFLTGSLGGASKDYGKPLMVCPHRRLSTHTDTQWYGIPGKSIGTI